MDALIVPASHNPEGLCSDLFEPIPTIAARAPTLVLNAMREQVSTMAVDVEFRPGLW